MTTRRPNIATTTFHRAIRDCRCGDAAAMVRNALLCPEPVTQSGDRLADWLAEGTWTGTETPNQIAREWESMA